MSAPAHTCTFYCEGATHAVGALAPATLTAEALCRRLQAVCPDKQIVGARPAREADVSTWEATMRFRLYRGATQVTPSAPGDQRHYKDRRPWLIFFQYRTDDVAPPADSRGTVKISYV